MQPKQILEVTTQLQVWQLALVEMVYIDERIN